LANVLFLIGLRIVAGLATEGDRSRESFMNEFSMRPFATPGNLPKPASQKVCDQISHFPRHRGSNLDNDLPKLDAI
jgi:hypothetical protein